MLVETRRAREPGLVRLALARAHRRGDVAPAAVAVAVAVLGRVVHEATLVARARHLAPHARPHRARAGGPRPGEGDDARDRLHDVVAQRALLAERLERRAALLLEGVEQLRLRHSELARPVARLAAEDAAVALARVPLEVVREEDLRRQHNRRERLQLAPLELGGVRRAVQQQQVRRDHARRAQLLELGRPRKPALEQREDLLVETPPQPPHRVCERLGLLRSHLEAAHHRRRAAHRQRRLLLLLLATVEQLVRRRRRRREAGGRLPRTQLREPLLLGRVLRVVRASSGRASSSPHRADGRGAPHVRRRLAASGAALGVARRRGRGEASAGAGHIRRRPSLGVVAVAAYAEDRRRRACRGGEEGARVESGRAATRQDLRARRQRWQVVVQRGGVRPLRGETGAHGRA